MFMRRQLLSDTTYTSDSATQVIKLPKRGALSALHIHAVCTNGSTSGRTVKMLDVVDKVEVLANGDRPIVSLYSDELLRWQRFWTRDFGGLVVDEQASAVQEWYIPLLFGLSIGDPRYFLRLGDFQDLELRVTYSPNIAADAGFATGTFGLGIAGIIQDNLNGLNYGGFFRTLNKDNHTSVASGDHTVELPLGHPYRTIMIYAHESGVAGHTDITDVRLDLDDGAIVFLDAEWEDLTRENDLALGLDPEYHGVHFSQGAETMDTLLDYLHSISVQVGAVATVGTTDTPHFFVTSVTGGLLTPQSITIEGSGTWAANAALAADYATWVFARGEGLGKAVVIDFTDNLLAGDPFDSGQFSKVEVVETQGGAGAQVRTSLSELVQGV